MAPFTNRTKSGMAAYVSPIVVGRPAPLYTTNMTKTGMAAYGKAPVAISPKPMTMAQVKRAYQRVQRRVAHQCGCMRGTPLATAPAQQRRRRRRKTAAQKSRK